MHETITERQMTIATPHVSISTEYFTAGSGQPLLLLHGVADSAHSWQWVMPTLARTHQIYAPSLPGFGNSAKPDIDYSPHFFTTFVTAFLDNLGLQRVSIVGNSLGGLIGMRLALSAPDRVNSLVLIDSAGLGREISPTLRGLTLPGAGQLLAAVGQTEAGARSWAFSVSNLLFANPDRVPSVWREQLYRMARMPGYLEATVGAVRGGNTAVAQKKREIMLDQLPQLNMPTLVIWGEQDRILPAHQAQASVDRLPQGQLALLPNCGHVPQIEQPEQVQTLLEQFLNSRVPV
jgi:pimeloyl-ACP methyl ester carboxylesterase